MSDASPQTSIRIPVSEGRVTSRDASLLDRGELRLAQDAEYRPHDPAIWKIGGRTEFNSAAEAAALRGLAWAEFDDSTQNLLIAMFGTAYRKAPATGLTGAFGALAGFDGSDYTLAGSATTLDSTHYANQHYLMNGVDRNRVVRSSGDQMFHSMLAATLAPNLNSAGGALPGFTFSSGHTITYWVEERVKVGSTIVKRSPSSAATCATLTGAGANVKPRVSRPVSPNPDTTHWALFATATDGVFPIGAEIAEVPIATTFIDDPRTTTDPALPSGTGYATVTATLAGTSFTVPKFGAAPISSTGDIFEDSLVMDDVSDPGNVVFSVDDDPHAVPSVNKFRIGDTKRRDKVVAIRSLDNICVIVGRDGLYRIATLPRPTDTSFSVERVKSKVHFAQGGVSPVAAEVFSFGEGLRLAYVARYGGVLVTDGSTWDAITDDVDWEGEVDITQAEKFVLRNNFRKFRLELFYVRPGQTRPDRCTFIHYHPSHAKAAGQGGSSRAKVTGPIRRDGNCAVTARIGTVDYIVSGNENGKVYIHDSGNVEPVINGGIMFEIQTGELFPADIGNENVVRNLYAHHQAHPGQSGEAIVIERAAGDPDYEQPTPIDLSLREATPTFEQAIAEAFIFGIRNSDTLGPIGIDYLGAVIEPSGQTKEA